LERPAGVAEVEAVQRRLQHVLRVHLLPQAGVEVGAGQADQPVGVAAEDLRPRPPVARPQAGPNVGEGSVPGHGPSALGTGWLRDGGIVATDGGAMQTVSPYSSGLIRRARFSQNLTARERFSHSPRVSSSLCAK